MKINEVKIKVKAFGINRLDLEMMKKTKNIGLEISGIITDMGSQNSPFKVGDRVCSLISEGGYAPEVFAPTETTFLLPKHLDFVEGAALPEALFTIALNLFEFAKITQGDKILIHSATGGIGNLSLEICRALGVEAEATTSRIAHEIELKSWGAKNVYPTESNWDKAETYNIILDNNGADFFSRNLSSLRNEGRLVLIDAFSGEKSEVDLGPILDKSLQIYGSLLRPRSLGQKLRLKEIIENKILPLLSLCNIKPHIMMTFPTENISEAHKMLQNRHHLGKLVGIRNKE